MKGCLKTSGNYLFAVKDKIKSIHDVLDDPRFIKEEAQKNESEKLADDGKRREIQMSIREALRSKKDGANKVQENSVSNNDHSDDNDDDEARFDARMRSQILNKRKELGGVPREKITTDKVSRKEHRSPSPRRKDEDSRSQTSKVEKLSLKKKGVGSEARAERIANTDTDLQLLNSAQQERHLNKQQKRRIHGREDETLAKLEKFKKTMLSKVSGSKSSDSTIDEEDSGWTANRLTFTRDSAGKDSMAREDDPNQYAVVDPLLEKGKEKFNKMQAKQKRRNREWAGKSLT